MATSQPAVEAPPQGLAMGSARDGKLATGLRLLLRAALALPMICTGIARLIPVQMPPLQPLGLLQRLGELTQGELLRTLVGASPVFQSFTGLAALLGGVLLLFSRTTLLGALLCASNLAMAITLAVCYDLPSRLSVSCLFLLSLFLVAPDLRRLIDLFLLDRAVEPAERTPALDRWPDRLLLLLGVGMIVWGTAVAVPRFRQLHPPKPPLYGAWTVEEIAVDGEASADPRRWRRAVFQDPGALDVETLDRIAEAVCARPGHGGEGPDSRPAGTFHRPGAGGGCARPGRPDGGPAHAREAAQDAAELSVVPLDQR